MTEITEAYGLRGRTMIDRDGDKIGSIDDVYEDKHGGSPEWALVNTGLFGTKKTFVPLHEAQPDGEDVRVPIEKGQVKDAPRIEATANSARARSASSSPITTSATRRAPTRPTRTATTSRARRPTMR